MSDTFARAGRFTSGYDPDQVDEFLEKARADYTKAAEGLDTEFDENSVRSVAFDWVRDGYQADLVDAALDRLETAFIRRRRARTMQEDGEDKWLDMAYGEAKSLYPRLLRPEGERFADADGSGYDKTEVDEFLARIAAYFDGEGKLSSAEIRSATFASAKNENAYDEAVVDVYLDRAVTVLLSVE